MVEHLEPLELLGLVGGPFGHFQRRVQSLQVTWLIPYSRARFRNDRQWLDGR